MKINLLYIILVLIFLSSFNYAIGYGFSEILPFDLAKLLNIFYTIIIFSLTAMSIFAKGKIVSFAPLNLYGLLILWILLIGLISNMPVEILPSLLRFGLYYFLALMSYYFIKNNGLYNFDKSIKKFIVYIVIIALTFGFYEVFFGDIKFMNGAYRLSGSFKSHPLANSMFLGILLILWVEYFVFPKRRSFFNIFILLALFYLFLNTHSRMPLFFLIFSYLTFNLLRLKKIVKALKVIVAIIIVLMGSYSLVVNTDVAPRLKTVFLSKNSLKDPSTKTRLIIAENTFKGMNSFEKTVGIGLGGFNKFYRDITDLDGVAAHNNFLLFYAEGGIIGLIVFLFYQAVLFITLFRFIRKKIIYSESVNYQRLVFVAVFLFEICSFLLNNYYFFVSQSIVFILMGLMMFLMKDYQNKTLHLRQI